MKVLILMGSPRLQGCTAQLCGYFIDELQAHGAQVRYTELERLTVNPCRECYVCQDIAGEYGCPQKDDMQAVADDILWADLIVLATPIFSWYCTAKMKAVLDRHYGFNKYYGSAEGCLWEGKKVGIIAAHGYEADYATEPFETGIRRLCIHSRLKYAGIFSVQDTDNLASFRTKEAEEGARAFARHLLSEESCDPEFRR